MKKHFWIAAMATLLFLGGQLYLHLDAYRGDRPELAVVSVSLLTREERCVGRDGALTACRELTGLEAGDILVTRSSSSLFYRHGHIGLVVDAKEGLVLEALGLGSYSALESIDKWNDYPTLQVLRLAGASLEERALIAESALSYFLDRPYGLFSSRRSQSRVQCATLIYKIFREQGHTLLAPRQLITPSTLSRSPYLELISSEGF